MKGVTSIAELRKRMRLTGAEVLPKKIHKCEDLILISDRDNKVGVNNCIWADHFAIGAVAR